MKMKLLLQAATEIKKYCADEGLSNEEQCPFFRGYKKENGVNIVQCALNLGQTSPCNWELAEEGERLVYE